MVGSVFLCNVYRLLICIYIYALWHIYLYITSHASISMCTTLRIAIYTQVQLYRTFGISYSIGESFKHHERKGRGVHKSDLCTPLRRGGFTKKQEKGRTQIRFGYAPAFYLCFPYRRRGAPKSDLYTPLAGQTFCIPSFKRYTPLPD